MSPAIAPSASRSLEEIVDECRALVERPVGEVAADLKREDPGRKVVGCFPVYSPFELVHAVGGVPLGLMGGGQSVELAHADARFQSFVCSISKSTLELGLRGSLSPVDGLFFHSICDVARNLSSLFARNFPDKHVEYLHLPQNMESAGVEDYLVGEYRRVLRNMKTRWNLHALPGALARSVAAFDERREAWAALYALRRNAPDTLDTTELYLLGRAGTLMTVERHRDLLTQALAGAGARREQAGRRRDRIRVIVEGAFCEQPPLGLLDILEQAGCYIVEDDLLLGWRSFTRDGAEPEEKALPQDDEEALRLMARRYIERSQPSSVRHDWRPGRRRSAQLVERVKAAGAQAVIFLPAKFCEPALFDYALFRLALDKAGIPHLLVEFEEKMWTFERTRNEIETFVESLLFD